MAVTLECTDTEMVGVFYINRQVEGGHICLGLVPTPVTKVSQLLRAPGREKGTVLLSVKQPSLL